MSWLIKWDGTETSSDDFLIAELGKVERDSGTPWSTANPFREVAVARAFVAVVMRRRGLSDKDVVAAFEAVTLRDLKGAFQWVDDDEEEEAEEGDPSAQHPTSTTPSSFYGVSVGDSPPA